MSIILHSDGLLGKIAGTVYGEQVTPRFFVLTQSQLHAILAPIEAAYFKRYKDRNSVEYGNKPGDQFSLSDRIKTSQDPHVSWRSGFFVVSSVIMD
jgi:hypothetical protein